MLQPLKWLFRCLLFVILFGVALHNLTPVAFHFYLGYVWQVPLVLLLLLSFLAGALLMWLASLPHKIRHKIRPTLPTETFSSPESTPPTPPFHY